jgi:GT2 family glycosyltransferase
MIIAMAVYDTWANDRTKYTRATLSHLIPQLRIGDTLVIVDNNSCEATKTTLREVEQFATVITLDKNVGTAEAINKAFALRKPGEHCIKIDNDIIVWDNNWIAQLEECAARDKRLGQIGLKRKDCIESTTHPNPFYKSKLLQLPHEPGQRWVTVEAQFHVMGSCVLHTSELLDRIGDMYQIGVYGFDDSFMSARCLKAGLLAVMLPHIEIDHIDTGDNPYQKEKEKLAGDIFAAGQYADTLVKIDQGLIYYKSGDECLSRKM